MRYLSVGSDFNFAVDNGDAVIGAYDMTLRNTATLSNYRELRHVVTAGAGHLVKQNYTGSFIFPVGMAAVITLLYRSPIPLPIPCMLMLLIMMR